MQTQNYRTEKHLENNLKLGKKTQLKKTLVKSPNQNIRNNEEIISQAPKQEIIMSVQTGKFQEIQPKNLSQFLLQTILKVYFLGLWKRKTKALKYYTRNYNPQRMNFKKLIFQISKTIKQHKFEYMEKLLENMSNLPMPKGIIHDANFGTIKIVNKETLFRKYSGIIVSLAEANYTKKIKNISIILVQVFKRMANSKKSNVQINRRIQPQFPDNTSTYVSKNNKITKCQNYSQENENKIKHNLSPQIQNNQYVFGKDIYNYNQAYDINKSTKKYLYPSIQNKSGYIYKNDIYNNNRNITNINSNSNRVINMNQQNRTEYISNNNIYNYSRKITNSIKNSIIPQSQVNQYISKNDAYNRNIINTNNITNYSFNNINKENIHNYNNNLNKNIQNKSKILDSKTKYSEYIKNQKIDNNKSTRINKNVLPHKIVKDINNYLIKNKTVNQNMNNSIRSSNNYKFLEIKVSKNNKSYEKNNNNNNRMQINNRNYYNAYNTLNNSINISNEINNNSTSYIYNGSLYYNNNQQKDKSNEYQSYFKKNYGNESNYNAINYNNQVNNKRYDNYAIKNSNYNNYKNYSYIPTNYNTINYTDNNLGDLNKYNTFIGNSNLYDNYNIDRNYINKKSSYVDNNYFDNGGYSGYYIYDNNNFPKGNNKRNNSYENNNEMTYQFYNGLYPIVTEAKNQYDKPKINQNRIEKGISAYGKGIPLKNSSIKKSKIYNKKQLFGNNNYYNNYIYNNTNLGDGYGYEYYS